MTLAVPDMYCMIPYKNILVVPLICVVIPQMRGKLNCGVHTQLNTNATTKNDEIIRFIATLIEMEDLNLSEVKRTITNITKFLVICAILDSMSRESKMK